LNFNLLKRSQLAGPAEVFELGIPRESVSHEAMRQIRVISITTAAVCLIGLPSVVQFHHMGLTGNAIATLTAITLGFFNLFVLRATRNPLLCGHIGVGLLGTIVAIDSAATGGYYEPNFAWLFIVPLAAAVLVGLRGLVIWTGITFVTNFGFWIAPELGIEIINHVPDDLRETNALFTRSLAIVTIGAISASFVVLQRRAERQHRLAHDKMIRESRYVELLMSVIVTANQATSFKKALESSIEEICLGMEWAGGNVCSVNDDGQLESTGYAYTVDPGTFQPLIDMTFDTSPANQHAIARIASAAGRPIFVEDFDPDDPRPRRALAHRLGLRAAIAVPILVGGQTRAVLEFVSTTSLPETHHLSEVFSHVGVQLGRVAERMALEERVRHSQKMEAVGQLAAGLAHEINNPMSYVRSNLNILRGQWSELEGKLGASAEDARLREELGDCGELIEDSIEGVERTIEIVRDVRDYSHTREDTGGHFEDVELAALLNRALRVARADAESGIVFESELCDTPPVPCIPGQIEQVFVNLIVNAVQAVGATGRIRLSTGLDDGEVFARVIDDGPGIAAHAKNRLFDPFFTTKPVGEGTGLGLSVSYEIVHRHGGTISVQSSEGPGTQFEVRLPVSR